MNDPGMRFPSKVDGVLVALVAAAILAGPALLIAFGQTSSFGLLLGTLALSVIIAAPVIWIFTTTLYVVTDTELIVRSGPMRSTITLQAIQRIRATGTRLSAPALSLDRLEIESAQHGKVVISPAD